MAGPATLTKTRPPVRSTRYAAASDALARELATASSLARAAGDAVMALYPSTNGADRAELAVAAARAALEVIVDGLGSVFPADAVLSPSSKDSEQRLERDRVWIVNALDGSNGFVQENGEFTVMVGLAIKNEPVVGAVFLPAQDVLLSASRGRGAWIERQGDKVRVVARPAPGGSPRLVRASTQADGLITALEEVLGVTDRQDCGSVGVKCALVATSQRDLYVHPGTHLGEWDTCAPEIVLREAGGQVVDCLGDSLRYNKRDPQQPNGVVAAAPWLVENVIGRIRRVYSTGASRRTA